MLSDRTLQYIIFVLGILIIAIIAQWLWEEFKCWIDKLVKEEVDKKFKEINK